MKLLKFLFFLLLSFSPLTLTAQKESTIRTAIVQTVIYCDHCKVCETCGEKFDKILLREKGVQMVTLDVEKMTIKVVYNSKKTDLATIKQAISKLGYDADDIKADAVAYEALDGCCKK